MFDLIRPWLFSIEFLADPTHAPYFVYPEDDPLEQSLAAWRALYLAQRAFDARPLLTGSAHRCWSSLAAMTGWPVRPTRNFSPIPFGRDAAHH